MSNKNLFVSNQVSANTANAVNLAGGKAYDLSAKEALAQFAACGTFNGTFYATPKETMDEVLGLLPKVDSEFVAKLAVYSREKAWLKDMPAFLTAYLSAKDVNLAKKIFPRTINGGVMVRNYAQMIRSGKLGRKSGGSAMKKAIEGWFDSQTDERIFAASIGNDPSLADVIKMVHPRPSTPSRAALYAYLIGRDYDSNSLPEVVKQFEAFKRSPQTVEAPDIDFRFLSSLELSTEVWTKIMENASWRTARMNINTFKRHGVLNNQANVDKLAAKIADPKAVKYAKVFPFELLSAYVHMENDVALTSIKNALHEAMELSIQNVPDFDNANIEIGVDVSGSMADPITGRYSASPSKVRCIDVAALIASVIKRRGRNVGTYTFDSRCKQVDIDGRDTIMTNVTKLAAVGGSTACSSFVRKLNEQSKTSDIVFIVSDNMSWREFYQGNGTALQSEWKAYKARNPKAKLILLDIVPNITTQAQSRDDILNIAGWNDNMFGVILDFITGTSGKTAWIKEIESIQI
jgi:60 kDa SS-A/Ro ribonucleoprotein